MHDHAAAHAFAYAHATTMSWLKASAVAEDFARWATSPWVRKNLPLASLADLWAEFA